MPPEEEPVEKVVAEVSKTPGEESYSQNCCGEPSGNESVQSAATGAGKEPKMFATIMASHATKVAYLVVGAITGRSENPWDTEERHEYARIFVLDAVKVPLHGDVHRNTARLDARACATNDKFVATLQRCWVGGSRQGDRPTRSTSRDANAS